MLYYHSYSDELITSYYVGYLALHLHEETLGSVRLSADTSGRWTTKVSMKNHVIQVLSSRVTGSEYKASYSLL